MISPATKLKLIKISHSIIWLFFNVVIFYMLYAVLVDKIDKWLWIGYGLIITEAIILVIFKLFCPLTILARRYSSSQKANFDIYLPEWLAKHNKAVYTSIVGVITIILIYQLLK